MAGSSDLGVGNSDLTCRTVDLEDVPILRAEFQVALFGFLVFLSSIDSLIIQ